MKQICIFLLAIAMAVGFSVQVDAALQVIGTAIYDSDGDGTPESYNLIYDNDSPFGSILWLDYTNSANEWQNQVNWAAGLNSGVLTYNLNPGIIVTWTGVWRLPLTADSAYVWGYDGSTSAGYNITSSEMGHLFYEGLGNLGYYDTDGNELGCSPDPHCLRNTGDFLNLQPYDYWSGTEYAADPVGAWNFGFSDGLQDKNPKNTTNNYALAVRPGEIAAVPAYLGDINEDGQIDISDVILVLRIALGLDPVAPCSNINGDSIVDISDVILTLRMALGLDEWIPCQE